MAITEEELQKEEKRLKKVNKIIKQRIKELGKHIFQKEEEQAEFQSYKWASGVDKQEKVQIMVSGNMEYFFLEQRYKYYKNLRKIEKIPYFGSIQFQEEKKRLEDIYIGITYLEDDNNNHLIYDWRSPISSLFYDYEMGEASYNAPGGKVVGEIKRKRQYKIKDGQMKHIFDNSINIDDELLQEVLVAESSDKMKNIVNTIQQEQNKIIRNTTDRNLIVQGIAGSGKTSVALHRIAFLLYQIKNLTSKNILIFSPNQIFTEYISNVLPELGEDNTMQTTFHDFLTYIITEFKSIESFSDFIGRYYQYKENNIELIKYKQSNQIIKDIEKYVDDLVEKAYFTKPIEEDEFYYSEDEIGDLFHKRYSKFVLKERLEAIALKLSENNYEGSSKKKATYLKLLKESLNIKLNFKTLYKEFYNSPFCSIRISAKEIDNSVRGKQISYEDATVFAYLKGLITGFPYNNIIKQIVIDEGQDYTLLQYKIISTIFSQSEITILGDINQTINPYYKYETLKDINKSLKHKSAYLELNKTYRSSSEIIEYANEILGLNHVSAIRNKNGREVVRKQEQSNLKEQLMEDISKLQQEYKSIAIITKDDIEANELFELLKDRIDISLVTSKTTKFNKELIVIPSFIAKGLEFDSVIVYNKVNNTFKENEKYLHYVAITRAQHELIIYNN